VARLRHLPGRPAGVAEGRVDEALGEQHVSKVDQLTYDKHIDDIRATTAGLVGVRPIDWQNRPTFQQVVDYSGHRPRS